MRAEITIIMCGALAGCGASEAPPGPCEDGVLGEDETDIDCGGPTCGPCEVGQACVASSDCFNERCIAESGRCEALAEVAFAEPEYYVSGAKPYFVRAGDLDGDGDLDLVVGNELLNNVSVFRNEGTSSGVFERIGRYRTGTYPTGGAIVDVDHDGIPDVITADYRGNSVSVLRGRGDGELRTAVSYPTIEGGETSSLAVGDLNGDGYTDVIAANPMAASASVFFGRVDGTLVAAPPLELGGDHEPYSVVIADFDGDGHGDAAIADDRTSTVFVWHGNGDGTFELAPARPAIGGQRSHVMLAHDMDRDGVLDLVISNRNSHSVSVLPGRGDGTFAEARVIDLGAGNGPYAVAVADVNLDGVPDIATPNFQSSTVSLLLGRRDGTYDVMSAGVIGGTSYGIATGDLDGDGKPDLAVANAVSNMLAIVRNTSR